MEEKQLVDEILNRVLEKIKGNDSIQKQAHNKPKLLILAEDHGTNCHEMLEHTDLLECYDTECAVMKQYDCDPKEYEAVILFNLSNNALSKLSSGICDSPFLNLASKAILNGTKLYIPSEEVELYQYKDSAPKAYFAMMQEKVNFLKECGIVFCEKEQLVHAILNNIVSVEKEILKQVGIKKELKVKQETMDLAKKSITLDKKVVTEKDVEKAYADGATTICITSKTILSDLAKDFAKYRNIQFERTQTSLESRG